MSEKLIEEIQNHFKFVSGNSDVEFSSVSETIYKAVRKATLAEVSERVKTFKNNPSGFVSLQSYQIIEKIEQLLTNIGDE